MNRRLPLLHLMLLVAFSSVADAQHGRGESRVTFFEKANFKGESMTLLPGMRLDNLDGTTFPGGRRANDRISSILVEGDVEVLVYEHADGGGHQLRLTESVRNLDHRPLPEGTGNWNDRISSIEVRGLRAPGRGRDRDPGRPRGPEADPDVIIKRAYQDILNREPDREGQRYYRGLIIDQGWTERMVRDHIRKGDEFRGPVVDRMIKRAYNDLLGRDPDAGGLQVYRRHIIDKNWTEAQLRDAIRAGDEYKNRQRNPTPPTTQQPAPTPGETTAPRHTKENRDREHGDNRPDR
jgi:hypothetical protein